MNLGFWEKLKKPMIGLAPMAQVTDTAFRQMFAKYGKPDFMMTEFVSCDGLCSEARERLIVDLKYSDIERPLIAQIFGSKPENYYKTALLCRELGFDGIDINMGCPDKNVNKQKSGAALINDPELAIKIIKETQRGAGDLPVSVKTRIGYSKPEFDSWIKPLMQVGIPALMVHVRTKKQMSKVPANWDLIKQIVDMRNKLGSQTLIIGNGDIRSLDDANKKIEQSEADGALVGRGVFGYPWFFNKEIKREDLTLRDKLQALMEHTKLFESYLGKDKNFVIMRKHYASYIMGYQNVKQLKMDLMATENATEMVRVVEEFLKDRGEEKMIMSADEIWEQKYK